MTEAARAVLARVAAEEGFEVAGIAKAEPPERDVAALAAWVAAGHGDGVDYVAASAALRARGDALLPGARTVVTVAANHHVPLPPFEAEGRFGRVAAYAVGRDYHRVLPPRLERLAARIARALRDGVRTRVVVDAAPFLERAAAARAGTGFVGKNTLLIVPRRGSWHLLGEILLDADVEPDPPPAGLPSCGTCERCLPACPTNAFPRPYVLDARRCISTWTIEREGPIPREDRARVGAWVFGCDVCQEVCPFNATAPTTWWPELLPTAGVGPRLELEPTLRLADDESFRARFRDSPLRYAGRANLLRNAAVVAANVGATVAVPALSERVRRDPEAVVRGHALAALAALDPARARRAADLACRADPAPFVQAEARRVLE